MPTKTQPTPVDTQRYRVTFLGQAMAAEGYGPNPSEAAKNARKFWMGAGGDLLDIEDTLLEHAVPTKGGGSRYEEVPKL